MKTVLLQRRDTISAVAQGLPHAIGAGNQYQVIIPFAALLSGVQSNEVIRIRLLSGLGVADSNLLVILQGFMRFTDLDLLPLASPIFAGTYNGTFNGSGWQGGFEFQSNDFPVLLVSGRSASLSVEAIVSNPDSVSHNVTDFEALIEVTRTQWSEPSYGSAIE